MTLMKPTESWAMTADEAARRKGWATRHELALRNAMEELMRQRMPGARMCHEMVMGAREVRADMVAVDTGHIAAVEVKGAGDNVTRLLHQVGLYQLCVPEVWMVLSADKRDDGRLVQYLLPSVGLIVGHNLKEDWMIRAESPDVRLEIEAEPVPRPPHVRMMLEMLWAEELADALNHLRLANMGKRWPARHKMIDMLMSEAKPEDLLPAVCRQIRARNALWRADPAVARQA